MKEGMQLFEKILKFRVEMPEKQFVEHICKLSLTDFATPEEALCFPFFNEFTSN